MWMTEMNPRNPRSPRKRLQNGIGRRGLFFLNFALFMIPVTYFGYRPLLRYSTSAIISSSEPKPADAIVVLAGGEPGRAWGAADLYTERMARYVVLTREPIRPEIIELRERGLEIPTAFEMNKYILHSLGVPDDAIVPVEPFVHDTFDELSRVHELAQQKHWKSLIILTSNYHTRRSRMVARYVFGNTTDFTVVASPHGGLNRDNWWNEREDVRTFLIEFEKLVAYTLYIWPRMIL
jgi:uncharacterized SAM-binding protein YcdF (DUF218 family)